jgi:hypothetical protein
MSRPPTQTNGEQRQKNRANNFYGKRRVEIRLRGLLKGIVKEAREQEATGSAVAV